MKRIIAMIIALALIGCLPAVAGEKPAFEFIVPVTEAELLPGAAVDVGGQFTVSTTAFDFEDDLGYYRPGSDRVGAAGRIRGAPGGYRQRKPDRAQLPAGLRGQGL